MGPIVDIAAAPAPRPPVGTRPSGGDTPPAESFEAHLDQQGAERPSPDGKSGKPPGDPLSGGRGPRNSARLAGEADPPAPADGAGAASLDPAWQTLLAQVLTSTPAAAETGAVNAGETQDAVAQDLTGRRAARAGSDAQAAADDILGALRNGSGANAGAASGLADDPSGATAVSRKDAMAHPDRPGLAGSHASDAAFAAVAAVVDRKSSNATLDSADADTASSSVADAPQAPNRPRVDMDPAVSARPQGGKDSGVQTDQPQKRPFTLSDVTTGRDAPEETRTVTVRNVSSQTHFPVTADPMSQIAAEVSHDVKAAAQTAGVAKDLALPAQSGSKTLNIQLEPESLGAVNVRMKLTGARLTIQIDVVRPETLEMITRSQETLHRTLQNDNIQLDSLTIRAAPSVDASASTQGGQNSPNQSAGQNQSTAQQQPQNSGGAYSGERSRGQREQDRSSGRSENEDNRTPRDRNAVSHGIYL